MNGTWEVKYSDHFEALKNLTASLLNLATARKNAASTELRETAIEIEKAIYITLGKMLTEDKPKKGKEKK